MRPERKQWITNPPTLDSWEITVTILQNAPERVAEVVARGRCNRKRGYVWTHSEVIAVEHNDYALADLIIHLEMVCEQDRPATKQQFERAMLGQHWDQPSLPF